MTQARTEAFMAFSLLTLSALCIFPTNLYQPIMPAIQKHFAMSQAVIQSSVTLYLLAESISPLFIGILLDHWGRKNTLLLLCIVFIGSCLICLWAPNSTLFLGGRILQGMSLSGIKTAKRALYRDYFSGQRLAKLVSYTLPLVSITLAISPIIGGYGQVFFGWQSYFYLSLLIYILIFVFIFYALAPNKPHPTQPFSCKKSYQPYLILLKNKSFMLWTTSSGLSLAFVVAYATSSPLLYQNQLGLSPIAHGWLSSLSIAAMTIGSLITHQYYARKGPKKITQLASLFLLSAGLLATLLSPWQNPWYVLLPYLLGLIGATMTFACAFSEAMSPWGHQAGYASALYNTHKHAIAMLASLVLTILPETSILPLALLWLIIAALQWLCAKILTSQSLPRMSQHT